MVRSIKQQAFEVFDLLSEREQGLVVELIKSLAPDDIVTSDDIAAHAEAAEAYKRGDTVPHNKINWN